MDTVIAGIHAGGKRKNGSHAVIWLTAIFVLAAAMRIVAVLSRQMIQFDETSYVRMADNLLLGKAPWDITHTSTTQFSILYPIVTASFAVAIRNTVAAAYVVSVLFSSLLVLPAFMFGKVMWNHRVGLAAAALIAVLPVLVDNGSIIDGQNLFAFWIFCAMFFGYRMQFTKRCMCGMLSGTCLGIAYLDDPSALYYLVVLFGLLVFIGFRQEVASYANKAASQFALMFLLFAIPNIIFLSVETGALSLQARPMDQLYAAVHDLTPGSISFERQMMSLNASGNLVLTQLQHGDGLVETMVKEPLTLIRSSLRKDYIYYVREVATLFPAWLLMLIGLGLFKTTWSRRESLKYGYFALMLLPVLSLPLKWPDVRFMLPFMAIFMLWAAKGWMNLEAWGIGTVGSVLGWRGEHPRGRLAVQAALALLVLVPVAALSLWTVTRGGYPVEYKQAGEWLKAHGGKDSRIMSREDSTAYYAGGTLVLLPYASPSQTLAYGRRQGADYLVISRQVVNEYRPQLASLLDPRAAGAGLKMIYRAGAGGPADTIIYQLIK
ncbi:MAG: hypothetical protein M1309_03030 [Actinobacteria bacterium]|nr:hypothetical protein [Actinomycetota bacterium]